MAAPSVIVAAITGDDVYEAERCGTPKVRALSQRVALATWMDRRVERGP